MNFVKKIFLTVISIGTIIGLALVIITSHCNKAYSSKLSELKTERTQQHSQLKVMREKIKNNLIANAKSSNSKSCLLYTSPSPRDLSTSRMPSSA